MAKVGILRAHREGHAQSALRAHRLHLQHQVHQRGHVFQACFANLITQVQQLTVIITAAATAQIQRGKVHLDARQRAFLLVKDGGKRMVWSQWLSHGGAASSRLWRGEEQEHRCSAARGAPTGTERRPRHGVEGPQGRAGRTARTHGVPDCAMRAGHHAHA